jgi:hypothetical protein
MAHCHIHKQTSVTLSMLAFSANGLHVWGLFFWNVWQTVIFQTKIRFSLNAVFLAHDLDGLYLIALSLPSPGLTSLDFNLWCLLRNVVTVAPWPTTARHRGGIQDGLRYAGDVRRTRPSLVELQENPGISHRTPAGKPEVFLYVALGVTWYSNICIFTAFL